jgi:hypothetical protein
MAAKIIEKILKKKNKPNHKKYRVELKNFVF